MAFFTRHQSTEQSTDASQFEQDVLAIANNHSNDLAEVDANGHSQFYNLFNDTINHYGDNEAKEVRR